MLGLRPVDRRKRSTGRTDKIRREPLRLGAGEVVDGQAEVPRGIGARGARGEAELVAGPHPPSPTGELRRDLPGEVRDGDPQAHPVGRTDGQAPRREQLGELGVPGGVVLSGALDEGTGRVVGEDPMCEALQEMVDPGGAGAEPQREPARGLRGGRRRRGEVRDEGGTGDVSEATRHIRTISAEIRALSARSEDELYLAAPALEGPPADGPPVRAAFIRAPLIEGIGAAAELLAALPDGRAVAARQGRVMGLAFHPESTGETRFHELFLRVVRKG